MTNSRSRQIVCVMARPWPYLFECWQTYYHHTPAKKWRLSMVVKTPSLFIFDQIFHTNLAFACFYLVFLCKWADFERRVACQPQHFWDGILRKYYVLCTYVPYLLQENINQNTICFLMWSAASEHLDSCQLWFLGCIMESAPKTKRKETSLFLVTVPFSVCS